MEPFPHARKWLRGTSGMPAGRRRCECCAFGPRPRRGNRSGVPKPDFSGAFRGECARTRAEDCTQVLDDVLGGRKPALEVPGKSSVTQG